MTRRRLPDHVNHPSATRTAQPGQGGVTSSHVGARLQAMHAEVVDEPLPEWLEDAACGPAVKHLAHLAMHTADAHGDEAAWREWIHTHAPELSDKLIYEAEECMRSAGLWPWRT